MAFVPRCKFLSPSPTREEFIEELNKRNIGCSVHFIPLPPHLVLPADIWVPPGDFPVAEQVFHRIVSLPLFPRMRTAMFLRVAREMREIFRSVRPSGVVSYPSIQPSPRTIRIKISVPIRLNLGRFLQLGELP